jgi:hypothetical protein
MNRRQMLMDTDFKTLLKASPGGFDSKIHLANYLRESASICGSILFQG